MLASCHPDGPGGARWRSFKAAPPIKPWGEPCSVPLDTPVLGGRSRALGAPRCRPRAQALLGCWPWASGCSQGRGDVMPSHRTASASEAMFRGLCLTPGALEETRRASGQGAGALCHVVLFDGLGGVGAVSRSTENMGKEGIGTWLCCPLPSLMRKEKITPPLRMGSSQKRGEGSPDLTHLNPCPTCALCQWVCKLHRPGTRSLFPRAPRTPRTFRAHRSSRAAPEPPEPPDSPEPPEPSEPTGPPGPSGPRCSLLSPSCRLHPPPCCCPGLGLSPPCWSSGLAVLQLHRGQLKHGSHHVPPPLSNSWGITTVQGQPSSWEAHRPPFSSLLCSLTSAHPAFVTVLPLRSSRCRATSSTLPPPFQGPVLAHLHPAPAL